MIGSTQSLRPEEVWLIGLQDLMNPAAWPAKIHVSNDWEGYLAQNTTAWKTVGDNTETKPRQ